MKMQTLKANQYIVIHDDGTKTFFSYDTRICDIAPSGAVTLYPKWAYSVTTKKYLSVFLNQSTKDTTAKLLSGEYRMAND